jgi:hypothetical protein
VSAAAACSPAGELSRRARALRVFLGVFLVANSGSRVFAQEAVYQLRIDDGAPRVLHVRAELPAAGGALNSGSFHPEPKDRRWDDYVSELVASDGDGTPLKLQHQRANTWSFDAAGLDTVRLSYLVLLEHDQISWPQSHAEAAYVRKDQARNTSMALREGATGRERKLRAGVLGIE